MLLKIIISLLLPAILSIATEIHHFIPYQSIRMHTEFSSSASTTLEVPTIFPTEEPTVSLLPPLKISACYTDINILFKFYALAVIVGISSHDIAANNSIQRALENAMSELLAHDDAINSSYVMSSEEIKISSLSVSSVLFKCNMKCELFESYFFNSTFALMELQRPIDSSLSSGQATRVLREHLILYPYLFTQVVFKLLKVSENPSVVASKPQTSTKYRFGSIVFNNFQSYLIALIITPCLVCLICIIGTIMITKRSSSVRYYQKSLLHRLSDSFDNNDQMETEESVNDEIFDEEDPDEPLPPTPPPSKRGSFNRTCRRDSFNNIDAADHLVEDEEGIFILELNAIDTS